MYIFHYAFRFGQLHALHLKAPNYDTPFILRSLLPICLLVALEVREVAKLLPPPHIVPRVNEFMRVP